MNYSLDDLPDSGSEIKLFMDISLKGEHMGKLLIKLFRDAFPAGVENFVGLITGKTHQVIHNGSGRYKTTKQTKRSYVGCKFFNYKHNNYIVSGDIYNNDGTSAGTIFNDESIPAHYDEYFYPHETKGLISLVPYFDEKSGRNFYDSTFMITLDDVKPSNILNELDSNQVVIGHVYSGFDVLDKMNVLIKPYARRSYPNFTISNCDIFVNKNTTRRKRPISLNKTRKFSNKPTPINLLDDESNYNNIN
ncbi:putative structural ppiase-like protein [Cotonvirus japonicus]|uniref:Structural ppiase-like protein n=1 Tax=Cotonvirus japonicus TaxID=2811091 RepID=A0ABM7NTB6_9VIRU|nr:putative structural ppiase-like protein [Cotonvirus japonicus]BCS83418.1 putative structural ppiase-like protein [Cotonvirus japonicus]